MGLAVHVALVCAGVVIGCGPAEPPSAQAPLPLATGNAPSASGEPASVMTAPGDSGQAGNGMIIEPGWVRERPELTRLFATAPACSREEGFLRDIDNVVTYHSYALYMPAVAQEELDRKFREAARALGYEVKSEPSGRGFNDEAKGIWGNIFDARVMVSVNVVDLPQKVAAGLATALAFESWGAIAGLDDATWKRIKINRFAGGADITSELEIGATGRGSLERWAAAHQLERTPEGWLRKWQEGPPSRSGITIDYQGDKKIVVNQITGPMPSSPACNDHPTRKVAPAPKSSAPEPTDDELIKQMMGK